MTLVQSISHGDAPLWDSFSTSACDFRPHWDGDLVNVFTTIRPQGGIDDTKRLATTCARELANWIIENRQEFGKEDRFQIIIGWPKDVSQTGRQIIKTGGDYTALEAIASGSTEIRMHGNWTATVFNTTNSEQGTVDTPNCTHPAT